MGEILQYTRGSKKKIMRKSLVSSIRNQNSNIENMERIADYIINEYGISITPVPIVEIVKDMGFGIYMNKMDPELSGFIAIDDRLKQEFNVSRLICVNQLDNIGHQRFTVAHELAHYLFDYSDVEEKNLKPYYDTYRTNSDMDIMNEKRANNFAANLLMPRNMFIDLYNRYKQDDYSLNIIAVLADKFKVSAKAVELRMGELKLEP